MSNRERKAENTRRETWSSVADGATKSNAKFTPGPWRVGASGNIHAGAVGSKAIATVYSKGPEFDWQSNANLIAAAPDGHKILDTLNALLGTYPDGRHVNWATVKAEIVAYLAKAEGR